jgi:hypothetical protein
VRGDKVFPNVAVSKSVITGFPGLDLGCPKLFLERYIIRSWRTFLGEGSATSVLATLSRTERLSSPTRMFSGFRSGNLDKRHGASAMNYESDVTGMNDLTLNMKIV